MPKAKRNSLYFRIKIASDAPAILKQHAETHFRSGHAKILHDTRADAEAEIAKVSDEKFGKFLSAVDVHL